MEFELLRRIYQKYLIGILEKVMQIQEVVLGFLL